MMAYCLSADVQASLDERVLLWLTNDNDAATTVDTDIIDEAIRDADATIDAYCRKRYTVPFDPVPDKVRALSRTIAIYTLYSRKGINDGPEQTVRDNYKDAIAFLKDVSAGRAEIVEGSAPTAPSNRVSARSRTKIFSESDLEKF